MASNIQQPQVVFSNLGGYAWQGRPAMRGGPVLADVMTPSSVPVMLVRPGYEPEMNVAAVISDYMNRAEQRALARPYRMPMPVMPRQQRVAVAGGGGTSTKPAGSQPTTPPPAQPAAQVDLNLGDDIKPGKLTLPWGTTSDVRLTPTPAPAVDTTVQQGIGPNIPEIMALTAWTHKDLDYSPAERAFFETAGNVLAWPVGGAAFKAGPAIKAAYQGVRNANFTRIMNAVRDAYRARPLPQTPINPAAMVNRPTPALSGTATGTPWHLGNTVQPTPRFW